MVLGNPHGSIPCPLEVSCKNSIEMMLSKIIRKQPCLPPTPIGKYAFDATDGDPMDVLHCFCMSSKDEVHARGISAALINLSSLERENEIMRGGEKIY